MNDDTTPEQWAEYHGIDLPDPGGSYGVWGGGTGSVNDALGHALSEIPAVGTFAERRDASNVPATGAQYRVLDPGDPHDGALYESDGTHWQLVSGGGVAAGMADLFIGGGQSNGVGKGDAAQSVVPDPAMALEVIGGEIVALADPVGSGIHEAETGSAWPSFAQQWYALTGRRFAFVQAAVGSTAQTAAAGDADGNWSAQGTLREELASMANAAIDTLEDEGYDVTHRGILWSQGEADAAAIDNGVITRSDYESAFETMVSYYRNQIAAGLPVWIFQTGRPRSADTAGYQAIRNAQAGFPSSLSNVRMASDIQVTFPDQGLMNPDSQIGELHYSQAGYNLMGETGATNVAEFTGLTDDRQTFGSESAPLTAVYASQGSFGETDTGSLSVGETGPVTGLVGNSGEYEYIGSVQAGARSTSITSTTSTTWTQPYSNVWRTVLPAKPMSNLTGVEGLHGSLSGRLSAQSGQTTSIRLAQNGGGVGAVSATEYTSSVAANNEQFHTALGDITTTTNTVFHDFEMKVSGGTGDANGPVIVNFWRLIE